jgi:hypothetical protein
MTAFGQHVAGWGMASGTPRPAHFADRKTKLWTTCLHPVFTPGNSGTACCALVPGISWCLHRTPRSHPGGWTLDVWCLGTWDGVSTLRCYWSLGGCGRSGTPASSTIFTQRQTRLYVWCSLRGTSGLPLVSRCSPSSWWLQRLGFSVFYHSFGCTIGSAI